MAAHPTDMRVLLASAEVYPFAKTGGLADVCAALPAALAALGAEVRVLLPAYESALDTLRASRTVADLDTVLGIAPARLLEGESDSGVAVWLLDSPALYRRPGGPYQDASGCDWPDNAIRFGAFSHAIARVALGVRSLAWRPQVVHCHDWHTGLAPYFIAHARAERPRTVFTIHNAAFQGCFALEMAKRLGVADHDLTPEGVEFYGQISFLKAAIRYADRLTTVSPSYARELLLPQFGCGLEGLIAAREADFVGILNGIDTERWNPATDAYIARRYSADDLEGKAACKAELQNESGMVTDPGAPIVAYASRLTLQKMADIALERLPGLLTRQPRMQFALVGSGEPSYEAAFERLARRFPGRVGLRIGHSEAHEHRLHAGADVLLHGARFEPCGLAHRYAMRYGALPVVRRVGGLADTVIDGKNGFVFDRADGAAMSQALERSLDTYCGSQPLWRALQKRAMNDDFGWGARAQQYLRVYAAGAS